MKDAEKFHISPDDEPIGEGRKNIVYLDPLNADHVIAFSKAEDKTSPNIVKGRYYLGKILHLLFPDNFADVHISSSEPEATVRQNLNLEDTYVELQKLAIESRAKGERVNPVRWKQLKDLRAENLPRSEIGKLTSRLASVGITIGGAEINFALGQDGNLKYAEIEEPFNAEKRFYNPDALQKAIATLDDEAKEKAISYFKRLEVLYEQEKQVPESK
ncbi:MAG: hypothetical protein Q8Q17_02240 [bacterium]|nr:hypothetical protein [bacterium]